MLLSKLAAVEGIPSTRIILRNFFKLESSSPSILVDLDLDEYFGLLRILLNEWAVAADMVGESKYW